MAQVVSDYKDGFVITGGRTGTIGPFSLRGGAYLLIATAASSSSELDVKAADGSFIAVGASTTLTTSAATALVYLPPCQVQVVLVATSDVAYSLIRVPFRAA